MAYIDFAWDPFVERSMPFVERSIHDASLEICGEHIQMSAQESRAWPPALPIHPCNVKKGQKVWVSMPDLPSLEGWVESFRPVPLTHFGHDEINARPRHLPGRVAYAGAHVSTSSGILSMAFSDLRSELGEYVQSRACLGQKV